MQALSDEQQLERLEKKVDDGFAEMRAEFKAVRAETRTEILGVKRELRTEILAAQSNAHARFRTLIAILLPMYLTIILGFAALLLQHHL
jgi:hypothetical protein